MVHLASFHVLKKTFRAPQYHIMKAAGHTHQTVLVQLSSLARQQPQVYGMTARVQLEMARHEMANQSV